MKIQKEENNELKHKMKKAGVRNIETSNEERKN